ncbi:MAG: exodeoxyribonuclease V subunit gamma [Clostridia bacterium]|nr:exodeoxyribonuclease V subunit gamma [Clostridia bacterium]
MITLYQTNNSKCAQNCIMQALQRTDQRNLDVKHVVIVPDRASYEAEKALVAALGGSFNTEVLTFRRLANRFLPAHKYLSKQSGIIALSKIINNLQGQFVCYVKGTSQSGFVSNVYDTISQLKYCNVSPQSLSKAGLPQSLSAKLHDLGLIYKAYQQFLEGNYVDSSDKLRLLCDEISKPGKIDNYYFYLYDFDNFSAQEYDLIRQFALHGKGVTVACPTSTKQRDAHLFLNDVYGGIMQVARSVGQTPNVITQQYHQNDVTKQIGNNLYRYQQLDEAVECNNFVQIFQGSSRLQEVYALACQIHNYVRSGGRFGDVYVVTSDVNKYKNALRTVFDEFDIPYFCDVKTPLDYHVYSQFLLDYMQLFKTNFALKSVLSLVKNPLFDTDANDVYLFENYCYKYNPTHRFATKFALGTQEDNYASAEQIRSKLAQVAATYPIPTTATATQYVQLLQQLAQGLALQDACSRLSQSQLDTGFDNHAKTTQQVVGKFDEVLVQMREILKDEAMPLEQFVQILTTALKSVNVSVLPQKTDSVVVVNMAKSRKHDVGFLALLGANTGAMPRIQSDCKVLTDHNVKEMAHYGMVVEPMVEVENKRERFALLQLLQEPRDKLFVSYTTSDAGTALSPSPFVAQLCQLFTAQGAPLSKIEQADENVYTYKQAVSKLVLSNRRLADKQPVKMPYYTVLYNHLKDQIQQYASLSDGQIVINNGKQLFLQNSQVSVSKITQFFACLYKFYFRYGLGIQKREEAQLQSNLLGNVLHEVLEHYVKQMDVAETTQQTNDKAHKLFDKAILDDYYKALVEDVNNKNQLKMLRKEAAKLCNIVKGQFATSDFVNLHTEMEFGKGSRYHSVKVGFGDDEFLLNGKIDRVDVCGNHFVVIDYKSGNQAGATYTETELYNGQKLQLLVYLRAVMENLGLTPVGFYYFNVHDKFVKPNQKSYFYSGRTLDNLEIAQSIDHELNQGKSTRLGISINKDGSISAKSNIITASQINAEIDYAVMMIANAGKLIKQGYVSINPLEGACSYCDYSSICDYQDVLTYPPRKSPAATAQTIEEIVNNAKDN